MNLFSVKLVNVMSRTVMTFIVFVPTYFLSVSSSFLSCPPSLFSLDLFLVTDVVSALFPLVCMNDFIYCCFSCSFLYSADVVMFSLCDRDESSVTKRERKLFVLF